MPSFSRLAKSGNRSQHAVHVAAEPPPPLPSGALTQIQSAAAASSASASASAAAGGGVPPASVSGPVQIPGPAPGVGGVVAGGISGGVEATADSPPDASLAASPPTPALSSIESFADASSSSQQQQTVPPSTHLYRSSSFSAGRKLSIANTQGSFDNLQQHFQQAQPQPQPQPQQQPQQQQPRDFASVAHKQLAAAQRYSLVPPQTQTQLQQQLQLLQPPQQQQQPLQTHPLKLQQLYGTVSTTSLDDLSSTASYHQVQGTTPPPPAAPPAEKRSTRKLFKGIFAKATGTIEQGLNHHNHSHSQSHNHNHTPSQSQSQSQSQNQNQNQDQSQSQRNSESSYDNHGGLARRPSKRNSRLVPLNTIRQIVTDVERPSAYDDPAYQTPINPSQPQLLQPSGVGHGQALSYGSQQQLAYDQNYSPQQQSDHQQYDYNSSSPLDAYYQTEDIHMIGSSLIPVQHQSLPQNPETISEISHDSRPPDIDQRSLNQQLDHSSSSAQYSPAHSSDLAAQTPTTQPPIMPPLGGPAPTRRATDLDRALPSLPSGFRSDTGVQVQVQATSPLPGAPVQPGQAAQATNTQYRGGGGGTQFEGTAASVDQGRNSPQPPSTHERDAESERFNELRTKYKNVKRLYFEGRAQIEQLSSQVEHLQNAVANQRMSQSRTALDDNEYSTRFNRLNGAINNLSFNIRKDWRSLPPWLEKFVSPDALKTGKQEMTAVGRAVISRWVVEELLNNCFHPDLDSLLSEQLKGIELGIRGNAHVMHSQEEIEAHTIKLVNWRMATLDGLQQKLGGKTPNDNRQVLIAKATKDLTACLHQYLNTPPPHGVEGSTSTIVELAVSIAANLPLESRDVSVTYPLPGDALQPLLMEVEKTGFPSLDGKKPDGEVDGEDKEVVSADRHRVRLAAFITLEVTGRQVLMKAPVWTL